MNKKAFLPIMLGCNVFFGGFALHATEYVNVNDLKYSKLLLPSARLLVMNVSSFVDPKLVASYAHAQETPSTGKNDAWDIRGAQKQNWALLSESGKEKAGKSITPHITVGKTSTVEKQPLTPVSKEKVSFQLGLLMAELELYSRAGEEDSVKRTIHAFIKQLHTVGASSPLLTAISTISQALDRGVGLSAIQDATLPALKPLIEECIGANGCISYYRFGEWTGVARFVSIAGENGELSAALKFVQHENLADCFLAEFGEKEISPDGVNALKKILQLKGLEKLGMEDIGAMSTALKTIIQYLS